MKEIQIAIDLGGSGLKVVASCDKKVIAFVVLPHVMEIPQTPKYLDREFSIDLTKNLWIASGDSCCALGQLALTQYYATVPLIEPKRTQYRSVKEKSVGFANAIMRHPAYYLRPMRAYPNSIASGLMLYLGRWGQSQWLLTNSG